MKFVQLFSAILACVPSLACSSSDGGSAQGGAAGATPIAFGGASSSSGGAANMALGGRNTGLGGKTAGLGGENSITGGASAGARSTSGGDANSSSSSGGALAVAGGGPANPPGPGSDGLSPYKQECHGDSLACGNPALRCLGLRDGTGVLGYSCSNVCDSVNDCNLANSGTDATPGCLDFVNERHCLLVCQDDSGQKTCPKGMSCYVYPGTTLGYCLWR